MHENALKEQWTRMTLLRLYLSTIKLTGMNEKTLVVISLVSTFYQNAAILNTLKWLSIDRL